MLKRIAALASGGTLFGNDIQRRRDPPEPAQQVIVRLKSGVLVALTQPVDSRLAVGRKVYIEGSGEGACVVPQ